MSIDASIFVKDAELEISKSFVLRSFDSFDYNYFMKLKLAIFFFLTSISFAAEKEIEIPLDTLTAIEFAGLTKIAIRDTGDNLLVKIGYSSPFKIPKAHGLDADKSNMVLIYSKGNSKLFHVNTPRSRAGKCILLAQE
jgi:hypothetical protein